MPRWSPFQKCAFEKAHAWSLLSYLAVRGRFDPIRCGQKTHRFLGPGKVWASVARRGPRLALCRPTAPRLDWRQKTVFGGVMGLAHAGCGKNFIRFAMMPGSAFSF